MAALAQANRTALETLIEDVFGLKEYFNGQSHEEIAGGPKRKGVAPPSTKGGEPSDVEAAVVRVCVAPRKRISPSLRHTSNRLRPSSHRLTVATPSVGEGLPPP